MKRHGIMYPMRKLGVQSHICMLPYALGQQIPFNFFFPSLKTEEQPDTVSGGFLVGFSLLQFQPPLHILPYHSYTLFWKGRYTWTHGCKDREQLLLNYTIKVQ